MSHAPSEARSNTHCPASDKQKATVLAIKLLKPDPDSSNRASTNYDISTRNASNVKSGLPPDIATKTAGNIKSLMLTTSLLVPVPPDQKSKVNVDIPTCDEPSKRTLATIVDTLYTSAALPSSTMPTRLYKSSELGKMKCYHCVSVFTHKKQYALHVMWHLEFVCCCGAAFYTKEGFTEHKSTHEQRACFCDVEWNKAWHHRIVTHRKSIGVSKGLCRACGMSYASTKDFSSHHLTCYSNDMCMCCYCHEMCFGQATLEKHKREGHDYPCSLCHKVFGDEESWLAHYQMSHKSVVEDGIKTSYFLWDQ